MGWFLFGILFGLIVGFVLSFIGFAEQLQKEITRGYITNRNEIYKVTKAQL